VKICDVTASTFFLEMRSNDFPTLSKTEEFAAFVGLRFTTEQAPAGAAEKITSHKTFLPPHPGLDSFHDYSHGSTVGYFLSPLRD
jgi:hypothetical protein